MGVVEGGTNLAVLKKSRKRLHPGDVFALKLRQESVFRFGSVIDTDAVAFAPEGGAILIYVHRYASPEKSLPPVEELTPDRLLLPPMMTNRLPWSRGYFETIGNVSVEEAPTLPRHCFWHVGWKKYLDEKRRELSAPIEPVGVYGLHSYRTIDDALSSAVGVSPAPG